MCASGESALLSVLTGRAEFLEHLATEPARKRDLADDFDVSRSTIERAISDLERFDLIECEGGTYRTTTGGELALEEFDRFSRRVTGLVEAREVLASLPPNATFDPAFVAGADVYPVNRSNQNRATGRLEASIAGADFYRAFATAYHPALARSYRDAILDGLEAEFAVTSDVLDGLLADHGGGILDVLETGRVELREAPTALPYGLVVADGTETVAAALVYTDDGLDGVVYTDDSDAVSWAKSTLEEIWANATPLSVPIE